MAQNTASAYTKPTSSFATNAKICSGKGWTVLSQLKSVVKAQAIVNKVTNIIAVPTKCPISRRMEVQ
jgi:hypothetical protein